MTTPEQPETAAETCPMCMRPMPRPQRGDHDYGINFGAVEIDTETGPLFRALRSELNIPWTSTLTLHRLTGDEGAQDAFGDSLQRLAKAEIGEPLGTAPAVSAQIAVGGVSYAIPLGDAIDLDAERTRLSKAIEAAVKDRDSLAARLANPAFAERAKPEAVEKARADHDARAAEAERLTAALARLG